MSGIEAEQKDGKIAWQTGKAFFVLRQQRFTRATRQIRDGPTQELGLEQQKLVQQGEDEPQRAETYEATQWPRQSGGEREQSQREEEVPVHAIFANMLWIFYSFDHHDSDTAQKDERQAPAHIPHELATQRVEAIARRAKEGKRRDDTKGKDEGADSHVHLQKQSEVNIVGSNMMSDGRIRTKLVPHVSHFEKSRGKAGKSTARMQITVRSIM